MKEKEYFSVPEFQTYEEHQIFKAEQYKVNENALESLKDSFDVNEDSSASELKDAIKKEEKKVEEKKEALDTSDLNDMISNSSSATDSISNAANNINSVSQTIAQTSSSLAASSASIAGSVAATVSAAAAVVVTSATILAAKPTVNLINFEVGIDYVSYQIEVSDLDESLDYKLIISNDYQTFEYDINYDDPSISDFIGGLRPNLQYELKVVALDTTLGETTYYSKKFYTLRGSDPEVKDTYEFEYDEASKAYNVNYDFYVSDYYNNGSDYIAEFYNNGELVYTDSFLDENNHIKGTVTNIKDSSFSYIVKANVYGESTTLLTNEIAVICPIPPIEEVVPTLTLKDEEVKSVSYTASYQPDFTSSEFTPILKFIQYNENNEIIDDSFNNLVLNDDGSYSISLAFYKETASYSYTIIAEKEDKKYDLINVDKTLISSENEYSFTCDASKANVSYDGFGNSSVSIPINFTTILDDYSLDIEYYDGNTKLGNENIDDSQIDSNGNITLRFNLSYLVDSTSIKAYLTKKYYDGNKIIELDVANNNIDLATNRSNSINITSENDSSSITIRGKTPYTKQTEAIIELKQYSEAKELINETSYTANILEDGSLNYNIPSINENTYYYSYNVYTDSYNLTSESMVEFVYNAFVSNINETSSSEKITISASNSNLNRSPYQSYIEYSLFDSSGVVTNITNNIQTTTGEFTDTILLRSDTARVSYVIAYLDTSTNETINVYESSNIVISSENEYSFTCDLSNATVSYDGFGNSSISIPINFTTILDNYSLDIEYYAESSVQGSKNIDTSQADSNGNITLRYDLSYLVNLTSIKAYLTKKYSDKDQVIELNVANNNIDLATNRPNNTNITSTNDSSSITIRGTTPYTTSTTATIKLKEYNSSKEQINETSYTANILADGSLNYNITSINANTYYYSYDVSTTSYNLASESMKELVYYSLIDTVSNENTITSFTISCSNSNLYKSPYQPYIEYSLYDSSGAITNITNNIQTTSGAFNDSISLRSDTTNVSYKIAYLDTSTNEVKLVYESTNVDVTTSDSEMFGSTSLDISNLELTRTENTYSISVPSTFNINSEITYNVLLLDNDKETILDKLENVTSTTVSFADISFTSDVSHSLVIRASITYSDKVVEKEVARYENCITLNSYVAPTISYSSSISYADVDCPEFSATINNFDTDYELTSIKFSIYNNDNELIDEVTKTAFDQNNSFTISIGKDDDTININYLSELIVKASLSFNYHSSEKIIDFDDQEYELDAGPTITIGEVNLSTYDPTLELTYVSNGNEFDSATIIVSNQDKNDILQQVTISSTDFDENGKYTLTLSGDLIYGKYDIVYVSLNDVGAIYIGKYGNKECSITASDTYFTDPELSFDLSAEIVVDTYDPYSSGNDKTVKITLETTSELTYPTYYVKLDDGAETLVTDKKITLDITQGSGKITYYAKFNNTQVALTEVEFDDSTIPSVSSGTDYYMTYANPGDAVVTYNDDSYNVYIDTEFVDYKLQENVTMYYTLDYNVSDNNGEIIKTDSAKFTTNIAKLIGQATIEQNIYYSYGVYEVYDGVAYKIAGETPSGGIERLLQNNYYSSYSDETSELTVYLYSSFERMSITDNLGNTYSMDTVTEEYSQYFEQTEKKFVIPYDSKPSSITIEGDVNQQPNTKSIETEGDDYVHFSDTIDLS